MFNLCKITILSAVLMGLMMRSLQEWDCVLAVTEKDLKGAAQLAAANKYVSDQHDKLTQRQAREFATNVDALHEALQANAAAWPTAEIQQRWKQLEPLMELCDSLPIQKEDARPQEVPWQHLSPTHSSIQQQRQQMQRQDDALWQLHSQLQGLKASAGMIQRESDDSHVQLDVLRSGVERTVEETKRSTERAKKL